MKKKRKQTVAVEAILVKILARLSSLKSIARFRSVSKEWKSIIDSDYLRDLYLSMHSSYSSVSWSIMNRSSKTLESMEIVGHHGCKTWGLTNSLGSFMRYKSETDVRKTNVLTYTDGIVLVYTENMEGCPMYHVGNPLSNEWFRIPLPPHLTTFDVARLQAKAYFTDNGLVTKVEKGIVIGYKVVWIKFQGLLTSKLTFMIYSSETGEWKTEDASTSLLKIWSRLGHSVPLNGFIHWVAISNDSKDASHVVYYDFYNGGDECCRTVHFPDINQFPETRCFKRAITTSAGFVMYCNVYSDNGRRTIMVWKLVSKVNHPKSWRLWWKLDTDSLGFGVDYFPVVMHPLYSDFIYLWSRDNNCLVMLNLRKHKFTLLKEEEEGKKSRDGCVVSFSGCKEYMDLIYPTFVKDSFLGFHKLHFSQYVLPRWINPLPRLSS